MNERADIVRDIYKNVEASLAQRIPSWKALPASDPSRIFMEAVAECAADLYLRVRPETEGLFERIPELARFPRASARPVEGMVQIRRSERGPTEITLPAGTPLFADTAEGERRFETTETIPLYSGDDIECRRENNHFYIRLPKSAITGRTTLYVRPFDTIHPDASELSFEYFTGSAWESLRSHASQKNGASLVHLEYEIGRLTPCEIEGTAGYWFRIVLAPTQESPALFLNATTVQEAALDNELELGVVLSIPGQTLTLPIVPIDPNFALRIEGDREIWTSTPTLAKADKSAKLFRYDPSLQSISFGDGSEGAIPSPRGSRILLTKIRHIGSAKSLERGSIRRIETDLFDVTSVEQPLPFFSPAPIESEDQYRDRFRTALLTHGRAVSPADFERLARSYSAGIRHVQVISPRSAADSIRVIVAGEAIGSSGIGFNTVFLQNLEEFLRASAIGGQEVRALPARERKFLVDARVDELNEGTETLCAKLLNDRFGPEQKGNAPFGSVLSRTQIATLVRESGFVGSLDALTLRDASTGTGMEETKLGMDEYPILRVRLVKKSSK